MIGVSGTVPVPSSPPARSDAGARAVATVASAATVRWRKTWRGVIRKAAARAWLTSSIATMLSPPRVKKSSSTPSSGTPSTAANASRSACSVRLLGARPETVAVKSGAGSALRSSFPLGSAGSWGSGTNAAGTM